MTLELAEALRDFQNALDAHSRAMDLELHAEHAVWKAWETLKDRGFEGDMLAARKAVARVLP